MNSAAATQSRLTRQRGIEMATAKQIAARKRFAEMARSGKLATMRKKAAKKPAKSVHSPATLKTALDVYVSRRDAGVSHSEASDGLGVGDKDLKARYASLKARRKNPAPKKAVQTKRGGCNPEYLVQVKKGKRWVTIGGHGSQNAAATAAETLNASGLNLPIRVWG